MERTNADWRTDVPPRFRVSSTLVWGRLIQLQPQPLGHVPPGAPRPWQAVQLAGAHVVFTILTLTQGTFCLDFMLPKYKVSCATYYPSTPSTSVRTSRSPGSSASRSFPVPWGNGIRHQGTWPVQKMGEHAVDKANIVSQSVLGGGPAGLRRWPRPPAQLKIHVLAVGGRAPAYPPMPLLTKWPHGVSILHANLQLEHDHHPVP